MCIDCLEGPPPPRARRRLASTHEIEATYTTRCANEPAHVMEPGDTIRYAPEADGWCCVECAAQPGSI